LSWNDLTVAYGRDRRLLAAEVMANLGADRILPCGATVGLKPNLVVAKPSSSGATTDPELAAGVLGFLHDHGWRDFIIMEGSWLGTDTGKAFRVCGYEDLAREFGARLADLKKDETEKVAAGGLEIEICRKARSVDVLIDLPVLKAHCQTRLTCALKNLKGCIPDREKRRFHGLGLHRPIACLAKALPVALIVVDAVCGDLAFEEGGNPVHLDRVVAGWDPVLIDAFAAEMIGHAPSEIEYIGLAAALGVGRADLDEIHLTELEVENKPQAGSSPSGLAGRLGGRIDARQACSACYGPLLHALARLEEAGIRLPWDRICVGQGFRNLPGDGVGIGRCTAGLAGSLPGCPPSARAMAEFLRASKL